MTGDGRLGWLSPMCACVCKCVFPGNAGDHGARVLSLASPAFILVWLARPCHQSTSKPLGLGVCDFRGQSRKELEMSECQLSMILRMFSGSVVAGVVVSQQELPGQLLLEIS